MQPYQQAAEEIKRQGQAPKRALGSAAKIGASLAVGGPLASRILPLLSEYIPGETMRKGLAKLDPRIGKFVESAINNGYGLDEVKNYIKDKFDQPEEKKQSEQTKQSNPLQDFETNYPELARGLMATIQNGQKPEAAAAILRDSSSLGKMVKKLEKETGKNFVDYVLELFGPQQQAQGQQPQPQQPQQQPQGQGMQQPGQQGSGIDQQLMAALDKILKM